MLFFLLACSDKGDDSAPAATDDSAAQITGDFLCADSETIPISADYKGDGVAHFEWQIDPEFLDAGGEWKPVDGPTVEVTCPPCGESARYTVNVVMMAKDGAQEWAYATIARLCEE